MGSSSLSVGDGSRAAHDPVVIRQAGLREIDVVSVGGVQPVAPVAGRLEGDAEMDGAGLAAVEAGDHQQRPATQKVQPLGVDIGPPPRCGRAGPAIPVKSIGTGHLTCPWGRKGTGRRIVAARTGHDATTGLEMNRKPVITAAEATEWADRLARMRPAAIVEAEAQRAIEVVSFNASGAGDGMYLRLRTEKGQADLFLNAALAITLADVVKQVGIASAWMNEDDSSLIVRDPENPTHAGLKS